MDEARTRETAREFADRYLRPTAIADDEQAHFRRDVFAEMARLGLTSLLVPKKYGGSEVSARCYYACLEELSCASPAMTIVAGVTNLMQGALVQFGNEAQQRDYLPRLVTGEWLGAFSLSEPNSGSDAASLKLAARQAPGGYLLNGTKMWCSNAGHADFYLVMGRTAPHKTRGITAFLVPKSTPGFRVGKMEKKLGLRASSLAELIFEDCFIPESQRLAAEGQGLEVALSQLDAGRVTIGAAGVGIATEALERVWRFRTKQEKNGGESFGEGTQQMLAEHLAYIQAARALVRDAATLKDQGERITVIAAQVKLLGSDLAVRVAQDAVHFMGEAGYLRENDVERMLRDAKALQIVEGTNQIQRMLLAREIKDMMRT